MARPLASLRRWVRPANLYHYTHKLVSWNKLGELVIFGRLGKLEDFYQAGNFLLIPFQAGTTKRPSLVGWILSRSIHMNPFTNQLESFPSLSINSIT